MTREHGSIPFAHFAYSDEPSGAWPEILARLKQAQTPGITSEVRWGAHEQWRGTRDFAKSSRLRLEKFLRLAGEQGLPVDLRFGFPSRREVLPGWSMAGGYQQTLVPDDKWQINASELGLTSVPSLFDPDFQQAFLEFVDEAMGIVALYLQPEGPVRRIFFDLGLYENDLGVIDCPSFVDKLQQRYPDIAPFNTSYRTTFKDFIAVTSAQGTRAVFDKRPWLAAFDYKWCRARMLAEVAERLIRLPNAVVARQLITFGEAEPEPSEAAGRFSVAMDPVLVDPGPAGSCYPFTPGGLIHAQAIGAFRLWEYLAPLARRDGVALHWLPPVPNGGFSQSVAAIIAGKYLSRGAFRQIDEWVARGGQAFFPLDFPQYDENLGALDWGGPSDRQVVKGPNGHYTKVRRGSGNLWIPATFLPLNDQLWASTAEIAMALGQPQEST
jgi:hypothetical protein